MSIVDTVPVDVIRERAARVDHRAASLKVVKAVLLLPFWALGRGLALAFTGATQCHSAFVTGWREVRPAKES